MSLATDDNAVSATVVFRDRKGRPVAPSSAPVWTANPPDSVVSMTPAADGMSAQFVPVAAGTVLVDAFADGVHAAGSVEVRPSVPATGDVEFGAPT